MAGLAYRIGKPVIDISQTDKCGKRRNWFLWVREIRRGGSA